MKLKQVGSNMTTVTTDTAVILFSYSTPVACHLQGEEYFRTSERFSVTTSKHINKWLDGFKAQEMPQSFFDELLGK